MRSELYLALTTEEKLHLCTMPAAGNADIATLGFLSVQRFIPGAREGVMYNCPICCSILEKIGSAIPEESHGSH